MPKTTPLDPRVETVLQTVYSNPFTTIAALALRANLSTSRLSHLFRQHTGARLSGFLSERRLDAAAELLRTGNLRVKEITYATGYRHEPSFVRAFTKRFGCSPNNYRRQQPLSLRNSRASG